MFKVLIPLILRDRLEHTNEIVFEQGFPVSEVLGTCCCNGEEMRAKTLRASPDTLPPY